MGRIGLIYSPSTFPQALVRFRCVSNVKMPPRLRARPFSTSLLDHSIYISTSTSPYFNLSVEDWLFRKSAPDRPLLLLYRNDPCVIIGRNQNPWKEVNFPALQSLNLPLIRRRSGGGTVYHDLGNTNFSIHLPRTSFNRHHTAALVQRALLSLGVDAQVNERNDICVGGFKMSAVPSNVSGSAYKIVSARAYHHGTMLISTELGKLGSALRNTKEGIVTKGVASVRSPVHNLRQFKTDVSHTAFMDAVIAEFTKEYEVDTKVNTVREDQETRDINHIRNSVAELQKWDWQYGQTPEFTHKLIRKFEWGEITADIHSKHGMILSCLLTSSDAREQTWCERLGEAFAGTKYASLEGLELAEGRISSAVQRECDIVQWLREEM